MTDKLTDEQAADQFVWLTNTAGAELQALTGGAAHAPAFDKASVDYLHQIADVADALADYYKDEAKVEDPAETPLEEMSEDTQKAVKEQEKAEEAERREAEKQAKADEAKAAESKPKHT
jgi:hypothetical protein